MSHDPVELHCLSNFSFQRGASHPEELVQQAAALGYRALAITDECSLAGVVCAHREIRAHSLPLKLIIGSEINLEDGPGLVVLARNRSGYGQLSRLITQGRRAADKGRYRLLRSDLDTGLSDCVALLLPSGDHVRDRDDAHWLGTYFSTRAWIVLSVLYDGHDCAHLQALRQLSAISGLPLVAATGVLMHDAARRPLADVLTAIRLHVPVSKAGLRLAPNAERRLLSKPQLQQRYPADALAEAQHIADLCHFSLDELRYEYPEELVPAGETAASWLRRLVEAGLSWRYQRVASPAEALRNERSTTTDVVPAKVRTQIESELALIRELEYEAYFLTVHDIVRHARSVGILCQGRGSAANSAVCWALGITEVDPSLGIMLVERFISRERNEPPDIDVDFEHERREEVIQYIYRRYGRERTALAATVIRYRARSAVRDVGRALGFEDTQIERLTRDRFWFDGARVLPERVREAGFDPDSPPVVQWLELAHNLMGFPRHLSQHVGGFVIARGRLDELVPIENAAMSGRTVLQWDKDDLDTLGLLKVDVLALGMLSALRRALDLVSQWRGRPMSLANIPRESDAVYQMVSQADTIGVFQIESRAQMTMLPRLRPARFYDLVVEVAIVRPGPIQGGMVHPYLEARARKARGEDPLADLRPEIRGVLERTLGVPIFQEQVMQLAVVAADFTGGEADQLRRAMGAWRRKGELERYRAQLLAGLDKNDYEPEFAERLCRQIEGFGSYGFPESHAASFALLVYASAWLKCFEPAAFLCALLNSQPMGFYSPSQLIQDARRHGVEVRPPEVNASACDSTLEAQDSVTAVEQAASTPAVRLGLSMIRGLSLDSAQRIVTARGARPYADVADLAQRARLEPAVLQRLAAGGALRLLAGHRRQAVWQAAGNAPLPGILNGTAAPETTLALQQPSEAEELHADYHRLGFTLGRHPLALLRDTLRGLRFLSASEIMQCSDRMLARGAGIVTCRQRPGTAKGTLFITLEDETGLTNVIVRPELIERQRRALLGARLLGVYGQISRQGQVVHLIAGRVVDHSAMLGLLDVHSRDFH
ncbi:error-prone DNA polymerase [Parazoarcus communis]|uniref:Error-prone DNA polymerase n=2 Tax=root TaxID=1 RepID=A0A323USK5_9RHOO|nr:error-prone DNA polymerase [Parazoarcus communis]NMG71250.1 DNA polymerase III subunit alpha [Parazoarcus communis SWub3 = DSM 12120]PZA15013.1 error-prone DNA polymerase [Azoarcus communis] [Parazoarcus communis SWub3 = DSM 12120]